ncbi:hypothetical protein GCM10009760_50710 [Kitasatospora kazusensis]|uniref:Uncharacterized protein n=1 Tax=Kitasatospora kazusensis TaxID=407974 RepID=A0ABP5LW92_9ACTN
MTVINEPRRPLVNDRTPDLNGRQAPRSLATPIRQSGQEPSPGHRAAAQLLGLREIALPAAVIAAADALLDDALASHDPVTREAAAVTRSRLRAALGLVQAPQSM